MHKGQAHALPAGRWCCACGGVVCGSQASGTCPKHTHACARTHTHTHTHTHTLTEGKHTCTYARRWVIYNDEKVAASEKPPRDLGYMYMFKRKDV